MSKPFKSIKSDPVLKARRALEDVLDRAIKSKDDERIVASATKLLQQIKESAPNDAASSTGGIVTGSGVIDLMTPAERDEVRDLIDRGYVIRVKAQIRNGIKPAFERPLVKERETRIIDAARAELIEDARRTL